MYYISTSGTKLVEESYTPESSTSPREVTEELLEKMGRPQVGSDHVKALPDEVKVEHCVLKAREVDVDFNEAYNDMDPVREILVRAAFVNTLIQVSNVEQVVITVNGEDLVDEAGDVVGGMTAESFIDTQGRRHQFLPGTAPCPSISRTATAVSSSGRCETSTILPIPRWKR